MPRRRPQFEMADPQLLVDQPDRLVDRSAAVVGHLDVGEGEELEDAVVLPPQRAQLVAGPAALDGARRSRRPAARCPSHARRNRPRACRSARRRRGRGRLRSSIMGIRLSHDEAAGAKRDDQPHLVRCGRSRGQNCGKLRRYAVPPGFCAASSASSRARSASASSRAAAAIAFTASNSSRPTKSSPPIHSRARDRARLLGLAANARQRAGGAVHHLDEIVEHAVFGLHRSVALTRQCVTASGTCAPRAQGFRHRGSAGRSAMSARRRS